MYFRREFGLERFVPSSLIESMKRKELRRLIAHFLKLNSQMTGSSSKMLTQLQVKICLFGLYFFPGTVFSFPCFLFRILFYVHPENLRESFHGET